MKKDILFLCQYFYPEYNSSATLPFDTAKYLVQQGLTVGVLCGYPKEYTKEKNVPLHEVKDKIDIRRVRYIQLKRINRIGRLINYFSFTASILLRIGEFRKYESVIVYSNPPVLPVAAILANAFFGTKIIFVTYDVYPEIAFASGNLKPNGVIARFMNSVNAILCKRVSRVVALTDEMKCFLLNNRPYLSEDKIVVIPNWAHENRTEAMPQTYEKFGFVPEQFIVSYFGNMGVCQEMETLVRAVESMRENENVRFLFAGHGSKKDDIASFFMRKKLQNVRVLDFLTDDDFEEALSISSCCVLSLEKGLKGLCAPSKYYSYLQAGKPVVAIVEKGSYLEEEISRQAVGKVVRLGDIEGLEKGIVEMFQNPSTTKTMGERAFALYNRNYASEIGLGKYCKDLRRLFER